MALLSERMVSYDALVGALINRAAITASDTAGEAASLADVDDMFVQLTTPSQASPFDSVYAGALDAWFWRRVPLRGPVLEHMLEDLHWTPL